MTAELTSVVSQDAYSFTTVAGQDELASALPAAIAEDAELRAAGLVDSLTQQVSGLGGVQLARVVTAHRGGDLVGYAVTSSRPIAAYTKIVVVDAVVGAPATAEIRRVLVEHITDAAFARASVAIKWQTSPGDAASAALANDLGFTELPAPLNAAPLNADNIADEAEDTSDEYPSAAAETPRGFVLWRRQPAVTPPPGYWRQTTRFTCGPVSLLVARSLLQGGRPFTRTEEVTLWRDATSGQGTDPVGLALASAKEGLEVELVMTDLDADLRDRSRPASVREVRRFFQEGFRSDAIDAGVTLTEKDFTIGDVRDAVLEGNVVLLLIDVLLQRGHHGPHWVAVYGYHDGVFLVEDASTAWPAGETWVDLHQHPVPVDTLDRQAWWGTPGYRAMIIIGERNAPEAAAL